MLFGTGLVGSASAMKSVLNRCSARSTPHTSSANGERVTKLPLPSTCGVPSGFNTTMSASQDSVPIMASIRVVELLRLAIPSLNSTTKPLSHSLAVANGES